jgi:hypothetical protein
LIGRVRLSAIAALVMEFDHYTFPLDERGTQAKQLVKTFEDWLDTVMGNSNWRDTIWPSKQK